jgi:hypothetical protein
MEAANAADHYKAGRSEQAAECFTAALAACSSEQHLDAARCLANRAAAYIQMQCFEVYCYQTSQT